MPCMPPAGYGLVHQLVAHPAAAWLRLGSPAGASCPAAVDQQVCGSYQACIILASLAGLGWFFYSAELQQRRAFRAALAADLSSTAPRRLSAAPPADLACASEYWLSFALPAVCSLFSFAVAAQ